MAQPAHAQMPQFCFEHQLLQSRRAHAAARVACFVSLVARESVRGGGGGGCGGAGGRAVGGGGGGGFGAGGGRGGDGGCGGDGGGAGPAGGAGGDVSRGL